MTSPLLQTPGDRREDHAQAAGAQVAAIYEQAELVIIAAIATLARKTAAGSMLPAVAVRHLQATVDQVLTTAAPRVRNVLDDAMQGASAAARDTILPAAAETANPAPFVPDPAQWTQPLAVLLDTAGDTAAQSAETGLAAVTSAAQAVQDATATPEAAAVTAGRLALPPPPSSPYGEAISRGFGKFGGWPGQSLSYRRIQAAQVALDDLADRGITGFTDRAGRNWDLATYVEMATRTAVSNAWDDMHAQAAIRSGLDLIETFTTSTEGSCARCIPWLGRRLSLTGADSGYPTLAEAKAAGFRHPSCRCSWIVIGGSYQADIANPVPLGQALSVYKASQHQRLLERRVRAAGRRAQAAVTPAAKARARRDLAAAQAASATHRHASGLRMMQVSVRRRERPWGARLPPSGTW